MKILSLTKQEIKAAAQVVANAFFEYPSLIAYFPDAKQRARKLPWYMERVLNSALAYGEAWTTEDRSGVLFLLPPDHHARTVTSGLIAVACLRTLRAHPNRHHS